MVNECLNQIIHLVERKLELKPRTTSAFTWEAALKERMAICHVVSYEDYLKRLQISSDELQEMIELIVIPETSFFRNKAVFDFLYLFAYQIPHQNLPLKILSLACSSGEEPYSIAMILFEAGLSSQAFRIDALDISKQALTKAQKGIYSKNAFRGKNSTSRDRYFSKSNQGYIIHDHIKKQVHFYYGNILDDKILPDLSLYQVIFCRNLLIYLNSDAQMNVLNRIKNLLAPLGILIVGSAESRIARNAGFVSLNIPNTYAFKLEVNRL